MLINGDYYPGKRQSKKRNITYREKEVAAQAIPENGNNSEFQIGANLSCPH